MIVNVFLTDNGVPATGLTPTIAIYEVGSGFAITGDTMTESPLAGFYDYNFTGYIETIDYQFRIDGGASLSDTDRWVAGSNEVGQVTSQLTLQDTKADLILGLVQSNFRMTGQTYDGNGNLTSAKISIYPTGIAADNQVNAIASYTVSATYGVDGKVTDYKVTDDST